MFLTLVEITPSSSSLYYSCCYYYYCYWIYPYLYS